MAAPISSFVVISAASCCSLRVDRKIENDLSLPLVVFDRKPMLVSLVLFAQLFEGRSDVANDLEEVSLQLHARIQTWSQQAFRQPVCAACFPIFQRDAGPVLLRPCIEGRI